MRPTVRILVTVPKPEHFDACTLCFDTLRVGFPTADIFVDVNWCEDLVLYHRIRNKARAAGCSVQLLDNRELPGSKVHLGDWISGCVADSAADSESGPLVILDADTCFWKSCEDWTFPPETLLAGYYVPQIWNDFAQCISFPRIHTSLMWMPNPAALRQRIRDRYPQAHGPAGEYCPCNPFMTAVQFIKGRPHFWDCGANLYGMLADIAPLTYALEPQHLDCFEHLNSASFYDVMLDRLEDKEGFAYIHRFAAQTPEMLRGRLWPVVNRYYAQKAAEAASYYERLH